MEESGRRLVYFAAERTLLSWMRTALGVMALGFVIDRFGVALRQSPAAVEPGVLPDRLSFWVGSGLVLMGVLMMLVSASRYWQFTTRYQRQGDTEPGAGLWVAIGFSISIAITGVFIAIILLLIAD